MGWNIGLAIVEGLHGFEVARALGHRLGEGECPEMTLADATGEEFCHTDMGIGAHFRTGVATSRKIHEREEVWLKVSRKPACTRVITLFFSEEPGLHNRLNVYERGVRTYAFNEATGASEGSPHPLEIKVREGKGAAACIDEVVKKVLGVPLTSREMLNIHMEVFPLG